MHLNVFLYLPEQDDVILEIADKDKQKSFLSEIYYLVKFCKNKNFNIFYLSKNIKYFLDTLTELQEEKYLNSPKSQLYNFLGKKAKDLENNSIIEKSLNCQYFIWHFKSCKVTPAMLIFAEIAERSLQHTEIKHLLLNLKDSAKADRLTIPIFKDATHIPLQPEKFIHIPFVKDLLELEIWLSTHHLTTFNLLDRSRFQRTSFVQQGKPVFEELSTGYYWYLDNLHKTEYEVFDKEGTHIGVASLTGELDRSKAIAGRKIDI